MRATLQTLCLFLCISITFLLTSCTDSSSGNDDTSTLIAVISYSPDVPETGQQVTLDASSSKDVDLIGFEANWSITGKPSGSTATLDQADKIVAVFTPDKPGDYEIKLEISNASEGISASEKSTISVTAAQPKAVELSGSISEDRILANIFTDPAKADYIVVGNVDVDAKLTIMPGVLIQVQQDLGIDINGNGAIIADGKADSLIVITGESEAVNGTWRGMNIFSKSVDNSISYAEIKYGGSKSAGTYFGASTLMIDRAKVQLSHVLISHSGGYGIQTRRDDSKFPMSNMQFENNEKAHGYIHTSQMQYFDNASIFDGGYVTVYSGGTTEDMGIAVLDGAKYKIDGNIDFNHNVTIEAGAQFEFTADVGLDINGGSSIVAQGTAEDKIIFTGTSKAPGAWNGIFISSSSVDNILEHVEISYGGGSEIATYFDKTNLGIDRAKVTLKEVSIFGSDGYGIQTRRDGSTFSVENSTFDNNADSDMRIHPSQVNFIDNQTNFNGGDVEVYGGDTENSGSETWSKLNNGTYYFSGSASIKNKVTIEEGASFEMGTDVILSVSGSESSLNAVGSSGDLITFSGRSKAKGAWGGLLITSSSVDNLMNHVKIEYGGGKVLATYSDKANLAVHNDGRLTLKNSFIENSAKYGIIERSSHNAHLTTENVTYSNNTDANLHTD
jgi:hypothetical protein